MLDLLHAILRRDWAFAHDMVALSRLFPCTEAGLKHSGADLEARSTHTDAKNADGGVRSSGSGDSSGTLVALNARDFEMLKTRTLFLRSIDAAVECMLVFFGMESAIDGGEGSVKKLVYRCVCMYVCVCVLMRI
jgi:hypothetical protein